MAATQICQPFADTFAHYRSSKVTTKSYNNYEKMENDALTCVAWHIHILGMDSGHLPQWIIHRKFVCVCALLKIKFKLTWTIFGPIDVLHFELWHCKCWSEFFFRSLSLSLRLDVMQSISGNEWKLTNKQKWFCYLFFVSVCPFSIITFSSSV